MNTRHHSPCAKPIDSSPATRAFAGNGAISPWKLTPFMTDAPWLNNQLFVPLIVPPAANSAR